jgi:predicted HD phosphohydrolase
MEERQPTSEDTLGRIMAAVRAVEGLPYDGEPVVQLQHALQCANLAREAGYDPEVIVAALLHDIGRSPIALRDLREAGVGGSEHGALARAWLEPLVGDRVAWLAQQHVAAKRYLVATDPAYENSLTETSRRTLEKQGGPMSAEEVAEFEENPGWREAVELRRWDDLGKDPGARVPPLESYEEELRAVIRTTEENNEGKESAG